MLLVAHAGSLLTDSAHVYIWVVIDQVKGSMFGLAHAILNASLCMQHAQATAELSSLVTVWPTKVLKGVVKVDVADGDDHGLAVLAPVEAALLQPLKVLVILDLLLHQVLCTPFHFQLAARCSSLPGR